MSTKDAARQKFSARLNGALDEIGFEQKKRQTALAQRLHVTQKAARKWLVGEGFPTKDKGMELAKMVGRSYDWLMTGGDADESQMVREPMRPSYGDHAERHMLDIYRRASPRDKALIEHIVAAFDMPPQSA